ncbi:hypothetical protein EDB87DRAFT_605454 [Lactarius vividus]|nr:hypothetical protein EDB87DRAFT_605454 [Lactarius vividus]
MVHALIYTHFLGFESLPLFGAFAFTSGTSPGEMNIIAGCYRLPGFPWYPHSFPFGLNLSQSQRSRPSARWENCSRGASSLLIIWSSYLVIAACFPNIVSITRTTRSPIRLWTPVAISIQMLLHTSGLFIVQLALVRRHQVIHIVN